MYALFIYSKLKRYELGKLNNESTIKKTYRCGRAQNKDALNKEVSKERCQKSGRFGWMCATLMGGWGGGGSRA